MNDKDFIIDEYNTLVKYEGNDSIVKIPDGVTSIGYRAFYKCKNLTSITIPSSVKYIGKCAFYLCSNLTSITIPKSVTGIGKWAFADCESLKSITIPSNIKSIDDGAFTSCGSLTSVTIENGVTKIGNEAFRRTPLTSITIPSGVKSVGYCAFANCTNLKSVNIGSVFKIQHGTFFRCTSLTSVTIPNGVKEIGLDAFEECTSLKSVVIPNSVYYFEKYAFDKRYLDMIYCTKGSRAEKYAKENNIPCSYIEQDKEKENKQQTVIREIERTPAKPIKSGDIVQLTNFDNLYGMVSGMNEDHIFVLDCNGDERRVKRSEESVLKPIKSSPAIKKAFCEMLDQIEMRQQIRDDIYNLQEQESECDSKIADNTTLLRSLLSEKGKNNRDIER